MPFALVFIGLLMIVSGAKNTYKEFGAQLVTDFTGDQNFLWWVVALGGVGALGYYAPLRGFSRAFIALILIAMMLAQQRGTSGGFFAMFDAALKSGPVTPQATAANENVPSPSGGGFTVPVIPSVQSTNSDAQANFGKVVEAAKLFLF
jgi:hypothetical protein